MGNSYLLFAARCVVAKLGQAGLSSADAIIDKRSPGCSVDFHHEGNNSKEYTEQTTLIFDGSTRIGYEANPVSDKPVSTLTNTLPQHAGLDACGGEGV